ncbi:DUF2000 family protein [Streptomyces sp. TG1A-8]|uniref:DUF2000 family protein n=1 Tax=Streptomyces sp. TG1A-8 TaxID=3051385 RepID=UPI00265BB44F|nr:DUF2000 family protein [Streptomyces sp. TG1A-8]MDO0925063.1 DUF2000 family protein [Streptomyces sp. TG1A-8]
MATLPALPVGITSSASTMLAPAPVGPALARPAPADGLRHTGTCTTGLPVLRADREELSRIGARAVERGLGRCGFPAVAQTTNSHEELTSPVAGTPTARLEAAAVAVHGTRKAANGLTGGLSPLR